MAMVGDISFRSSLDRFALGGLSWGTGLYVRWAAPLGAMILSLYVGIVALTAIGLPHVNWDMLPYLAVAEESRHPDPAELHAYVYKTIEAGVPAGDYQALVDDSGGFRTHMAADAADFQLVLSMYRVKYLYARILEGLDRVMPPVMAMHAIQAFSTVLFGAAVLAWLYLTGTLALAPLVVAVMNMGGFADAALTTGPDLLSSALLLIGLLGFIRHREVLAGAFIFLAVLVRLDHIVLAALLAVMVAAFRLPARGTLLAAVACFLVYLPITHAAGHPGWWPHLYFSTIDMPLSMIGFDPPFSLTLYATAFVHSVVRALTFDSWIGVAVLALGGWLLCEISGFRLDRRAGILFAALVLTMLAKFVVFPIHDTRIYFAYLVPPFLLLAPRLIAMPAAMRGSVRRRESILQETSHG